MRLGRGHRRFLFALGCSVLAAGGVAAKEPYSSVLRPLAPGVFVRQGEVADWGADHLAHVANLGLVVGSRCAAVIDTGGSPADGEAFMAEVERTTSVPVCYVINTHAHPDHVLGNQAFEGQSGISPEFVGHVHLPAALQTRGPFYLNALRRNFVGAEREARIVPPTRIVDKQAVLDLGNRRLRLIAWPTAHTDSDLTVLDESTGVVFLGDLLFVDHVPVLDGKLKGWLSALQLLSRGDFTLAVPGHGAPQPGWRRALAAQQDYLAQLQADTRRAIKDGLTLSQAVERVGPGTEGWRLLDVFHKRNVTAAYAELEWEE